MSGSTGDRRAPVDRLVIGSRRSRLARRQCAIVERRIRAVWPHIRLERVTISTAGDEMVHRPLPELGGKGTFTAELERALLSGQIDIAVHSAKDLPTEFDPALAILAVTDREDPADVLVTCRHDEVHSVEDLPAGAVVGTSSLRRRAQLLRRCPESRPRSIRGNVETRLEKLERGEYDALILAAAGLARLDLLDERTLRLDPTDWLPAPGQGALATQGRADDTRVGSAMAAIDEASVRSAVVAERAFLAALEGGCTVPIAALATVEADELTLRGAVFAAAGKPVAKGEQTGPTEAPERVGRALAGRLRASGGDSILAGFRDRAL